MHFPDIIVIIKLNYSKYRIYYNYNYSHNFDERYGWLNKN